MTSLKDKAFSKLCDNYCLKKKCPPKTAKVHGKSSGGYRETYNLSPNADEQGTSMQLPLRGVTTAQLKKSFGSEAHDAGDERVESGYGKKWIFKRSGAGGTSYDPSDIFTVYSRNEGRGPVYRIGAENKPDALKFKRWLTKELFQR